METMEATVRPKYLYHAEPEPPNFDFPTLVVEDGIPLETAWHRSEMDLLIESTHHRRAGSTDYYVGGNMFIYYSFRQARNLDYRGPDFFLVLDVDGTKYRDAWVVWEEDGRYPNVIIELLSPSTAQQDRTIKKELYEKSFRTPEYFCYNPDGEGLFGWRLQNGDHYVPIAPDEKGWLWSTQMELWLGEWTGPYHGAVKTWLRFFDRDGNLILTPAEAEKQRADLEKQRAETEKHRADSEKQCAETEKQRADEVASEAERLRQKLRAAGIDPDVLGH